MGRLSLKSEEAPTWGIMDLRSYGLSQSQIDGMTDQELAVWYNDNVIYPDKVRINCYYYRNYSFIKDIQMIFCTILGKKMKYGGGDYLIIGSRFMVHGSWFMVNDWYRKDGFCYMKGNK